MKRVASALVVIVALLALALGFGVTTAALYVTQPSSSAATTVHFVVIKGDSAAAVADNLQKAGLIRNAQLFRLWARYRHKDSGIEWGVYDLHSNMTMDQILITLQTGKPNEYLAGVPDGKRITEYPAYLAKDLPKFNSDSFLATAKTASSPTRPNSGKSTGTSSSRSQAMVSPIPSKATCIPNITTSRPMPTRPRWSSACSISLASCSAPAPPANLTPILYP